MNIEARSTDALVESLLHQIAKHIDVASLEKLGETAVLFDGELDAMRFMLTCKPIAPTNHVHLSPREEEIIRLIIKGLSNKEIAAVLEISQWTVATHLRRVFSKLDVCSRAEMVAKVLNEALIA